MGLGFRWSNVFSSWSQPFKIRTIQNGIQPRQFYIKKVSRLIDILNCSDFNWSDHSSGYLKTELSQIRSLKYSEVIGLRCSDFEPTLYVLLILFTDREMGAKNFFLLGRRKIFVGAKKFSCWANENLAQMIRENIAKKLFPQADLCPVSR